MLLSVIEVAEILFTKSSLLGNKC